MRTIDLDAPEIDRSDPSRAKAAADSDRLLTAELHCYVSAVPRPTVTWIKVRCLVLEILNLLTFQRVDLGASGQSTASIVIEVHRGTEHTCHAFDDILR